MSQLAAVDAVPVEQTRRARGEGESGFGKPVFLPEARWLDGVRVRVVAAEGLRGVYLHLHGGGRSLGAADLQDVPLRALAHATGLTVVSVEYRLAPDHPFPAGPDGVTAARRLAARGAAELGAPALVAIAGESGGAHLAVLTVLARRGEVEFAAANLFDGAYDLSGTLSRHAYDDFLVLSPTSMGWFTESRPARPRP